ncbi:uncharacterized protein LOC123662483 [Melitaea cinxia]|uniref:uncharacterized protein LOC123662483 n=1 Tax=Melitaea cinxia TaxID=113334 RepID=UPI001E274A57|nr:uncharacterized protein LOC123662483 [Melitaea cinxia]
MSDESLERPMSSSGLQEAELTNALISIKTAKSQTVSVNMYKYIGCIVNGQNDHNVEIKCRIEQAVKNGKRNKGRQMKRWEDDLKKVAGPVWMRIARDRSMWKKLEEAYVEGQAV